MDVFQRAILRLCRAGLRRPDLLGQRLCLEPKLCEHILQQLQHHGYLTDDYEPTRSGIDALATGDIDPLDSVVVYVFQDPFTRQLWPSAVDRIYPGEVLWRRGQRLLVRGDAGDRREFDLVTVRPPNDAQPRLPEALDILQAVRHFKLPERDAQDFDMPRGDSAIRRTSLVDDRPEPVWLATYLFGEWRSKDTSFPWQARDPLGPRPSTMLRRLVMARSEEDETLRTAVGRLVGQREASRIEAANQARAEVRRDAADWLDLELTLRIRDHEKVRRLLVDMETNYRLGRDGPGGTDFENVARNALRAFEIVFRQMLRDYPMDSADLALFSKPKSNSKSPAPNNAKLEAQKSQVANLVSEQAKIIGIARNGKLMRLVESNFAGIGNAARQPERADFQPSLPALVLATRNHPSHPLARAARNHPDMIDTLVTMALLRNPTSHEDIKDLAQDDVELVRGAALSLLPILLDISPPVKKVDTPHGPR
ncbi:hypothetical protein [Parafrankia sp. FMc2]|uniref:hypothetical protein n=1 Tax=Parafrankia sp. FMc2 TaxID=3233196 RepID=UPI0034D5086A